MTEYTDNGLTKEEVTEYLDELRESSVCNMLQAYVYLAAHFNISQWTARDMCATWRKEYGSRHS